jgi:hypothetical protein
MRLSLVAALVAVSSALTSTQTPDANQVIASARDALGGEKKLSAVKSFVATGRTRQVRGNNLVPIEFEIACELPDKYVRHDEIPAQDSDPTTVGFNGETLIQAPPPGAGRGGAGRGGVPRIVAVKQDFARLMLGMFAASLPSFPLTFKYAGLGEAPDGKADVIDVTGPANFSARLIVQRDTHLPVMLMWEAPGPAQPKPVEQRMYFADFRDVDGLKLPFRTRRAVGGETIEETTFDRIRINPKIDPRKFEARP